MKRILITGMSGTGKSAVVRELLARGFRAIDLDTPEWSEWVKAAPDDALTPAEGEDWLWREDRVRTLLSQHDRGLLFISGCAENMERLFPLIETIFLLSAPIETVMHRLQARGADGYGSTPEERDRIAALIAMVEPLQRESADHEIDSSGPVAATTDSILALVGT